MKTTESESKWRLRGRARGKGSATEKVDCIYNSFSRFRSTTLNPMPSLLFILSHCSKIAFVYFSAWYLFWLI